MKRVAVVGLGYVGITLAAALARRGFTVIGYDREARVREALAAGHTHLYEPGIEEALAETLGRTFHVRADLKGAEVDAAVICVSTPVDDVTRQPRLESLRSAARQIADELGPETLVVVRSTVPVGASRGVVLPELSARWGAVRLAFSRSSPR
jgi:UDP-N-acetyl-D-mannosaminuronic acid dehydrogenase